VLGDVIERGRWFIAAPSEGILVAGRTFDRQQIDSGMACMTDDIRIIKHEIVPKSGSYEVRFSDGRPSGYFYWDDVPTRRLRSNILTSDQALEQAEAFAQAERDKES
jgi:hypothetical protein